MTHRKHGRQFNCMESYIKQVGFFKKIPIERSAAAAAAAAVAAAAAADDDDDVSQCAIYYFV